MRQIISLLLISILILPAAPVSAQDVTPNPELGERLHNMSRETERFRLPHATRLDDTGVTSTDVPSYKY